MSSEYEIVDKIYDYILDCYILEKKVDVESIIDIKNLFKLYIESNNICLINCYLKDELKCLLSQMYYDIKLDSIYEGQIFCKKNAIEYLLNLKSNMNYSTCYPCNI